MCFIITCSLQSVWRHDPHPINNTGATLCGHRVTARSGARHHITSSQAQLNTSFRNQRGQWRKYPILQSDTFYPEELKLKINKQSQTFPNLVLPWYSIYPCLNNTYFSFSVRHKKIPKQQCCRTSIYSYQHPGYCILLISWSCHAGNTLSSCNVTSLSQVFNNILVWWSLLPRDLGIIYIFKSGFCNGSQK